MRNLRQCAALWAVLTTGWFLGCASRPEEAIKQAQKAMDEAKQEQAADFAPGDWKSAQAAWDEAQAALAKQSHGDAATHLVQAKNRFERARNIARAKRDDVRKDAGVLQSAVNQRFAAAKELFGSGRIKGKALNALKEPYQETEAVVEKVNGDMLNDRLLEAQTGAKAAMQKLDELQKKMASLDKKLAF